MLRYLAALFAALFLSCATYAALPTLVDIDNKPTEQVVHAQPETVECPEMDAMNDEPLLLAQGGCCKICTKGKACGNSCISRSYTCHQPRGCACNG